MGLLRKGLHWGTLRGLVRLTGTKAHEEFGFTTKPDAEGIVFRLYHYVTSGGVAKKGVFINNWKKGFNPQTVSQQANRVDKFGVLSKIVSAHRDTFYPIWQPLAEKHHSKIAHWGNEFRSVNMKRIGTPPDFTKMLISNGKLEGSSQITGFFYDAPASEVVINFDSGTYRNGNPSDVVYGAIFIESLKSLEFPQATKVWRRRDRTWRGHVSYMYPTNTLIAFVFFNDACNYSPSVSLHG